MIANYLIIADKLASLLQDNTLTSFDIDKGQLDNPMRYESLLLPAVLIGGLTVPFNTQLGKLWQRGTGTFTVKTIVRLPETTFILQSDIPAALQRFVLNIAHLRVAEKVNEKIMALTGCERTQYKEYNKDTLYVCEQTYQASIEAEVTTATYLTIQGLKYSLEINTKI